MKPQIKTIFLDMDGVLCDFIGPALRELDRPELLHRWPAGEHDLLRVLNSPPQQVWPRLDRLNFWLKLPKLPWCDALVAAVGARAELHVCSDHRGSPVCAYAKQEWLNRELASLHFDTIFARMHLTSHKQHLAQPTTLLIDDSDANVTAFRDAGGHAILFPQRWNSRHAIAHQDSVRAVLFQLDDEFDFYAA